MSALTRRSSGTVASRRSRSWVRLVFAPETGVEGSDRITSGLRELGNGDRFELLVLEKSEARLDEGIVGSAPTLLLDSLRG
jgi:hypothetical protein